MYFISRKPRSKGDSSEKRNRNKQTETKSEKILKRNKAFTGYFIYPKLTNNKRIARKGAE
jgi:hypothetical protein